jgi:WD40-like Beta Propeller Repeat
LNGRTAALLAIAAVCVSAGGVYVAVASLSAGGTTSDARPRVTVHDRAAADLPPRGELLVRAVDRDNPRLNGRVFRVELATGETAEPAGDLACERVYANASGTGLCLAVAPNGFDYEAVVFDGDYERRSSFRVPGVPDRARVSPDGRYGAFTTFLSGHTYSAGVRQFSTHTAIVDMRTGEPLLALDELEVTRDGEPFERSDANFWGVTFLGGDRFHATMGTGGRHYLLDGRVGTGSARVVRDHVECPSISPDGTRIAYKRRIGKQDRWRLHVLDVESGRDTALAERRTIDDQPEWLGDDHVVYSDDEHVYVVRADGGGSPHRVVARASSPVGIE